ncbi:MAG TPA: porin [Pelobium sp.]|nr:porin [Pelobium sp.]
MKIFVFLFVLCSSICLSATAQTESDEQPVQFEGINFYSKDSLFYMKFRFRMQSRVGFSTLSADDLGVNEWDARIRRLRLRGDGFILGEKLGYSVQLSFSRGDQDFENTGVANIVRDAVIFYNFNKHFYIAFGQNKLPGNRQRVNSSGQLQFAERSIVNSALTLDRDFGLKAYYTNNLGSAVYQLKGAVSTGEGRSVNSTDKGLAYTSRVEFLPFGDFTNGGDYSEGDLEREPKPKLSLAGGYSYNKATTKKGGQLGKNLFSGVDMKTTIFDALFKYRGWAYAIEYLKRTTDNPFTYNDLNELSYAYEGSGINQQASYIFKNNFETAFRYSLLQPSNRLNSLENQREVLELGLTKYIINHKVKTQLNLSYNVSDGNYGIQNNANFWAALFQIELGI